MLTCKNCKELDKETFENTTLRTCKLHIKILKLLNERDKIHHRYLTDALKSENDECIFEKI